MNLETHQNVDYTRLRLPGTRAILNLFENGMQRKALISILSNYNGYKAKDGESYNLQTEFIYKTLPAVALALLSFVSTFFRALPA